VEYQLKWRYAFVIDGNVSIWEIELNKCFALGFQNTVEIVVEAKFKTSLLIIEVPIKV